MKSNSANTEFVVLKTTTDMEIYNELPNKDV